MSDGQIKCFYDDQSVLYKTVTISWIEVVSNSYSQAAEAPKMQEGMRKSVSSVLLPKANSQETSTEKNDASKADLRLSHKTDR